MEGGGWSLGGCERCGVEPLAVEGMETVEVWGASSCRRCGVEPLVVEGAVGVEWSLLRNTRVGGCVEWNLSV